MTKATLTFISLFLIALAGPITAAEPDSSAPESAAMLMVNINEASAEQLAEALSGVGEGRALAIVEYRDQHGPFASVEELVEVKGIGDAILAANASRIEL